MMRTALDRLMGWMSSRRHGPNPSVSVGTLPPSPCGDEPRNPCCCRPTWTMPCSAEERRIVDSHLPLLPCLPREAGRLHQAGGRHPRHGPQAVPYSLDRKVATLATSSRWGGAATAPLAPWLLRPAVAVTALGLMVAVVLVSGIPFPGSEPPMVAAAYLADDQGEQTFVIRFAGPVDQEKVEQSHEVDPPIAVNVEWRGQTMLVKPAERVRDARLIR